MADTDVLTEEEALVAINRQTRDSDPYLSRLIESISQRLDTLCGPIVIRTVTNEEHDGNCYAIRPRYTPVVAFSSVVEATGTTTKTLTAETFATVPADAYRLDPTTNYLYRRSSGSPTCFANRVRLTYTAGRAADTDAVPARFKDAAAIILAHIWRNEHGTGSQTFGGEIGENFGSTYSIPNRALELIAGDRQYAVA